MKQYHWDDIEHIVSFLLSGQMDESDTNCAKAIWAILESDNLTTYKSDKERNQVLVLLLGVIEFVNDCTSLIREDNYELDIVSWASEAEINAFRIAQLVGADFEESEEYEFEELYELALISLLENARQEIVSAINRKYNGVSEVMKFIRESYERASENDTLISEDSELFDNVRIPVNVIEFSNWIDDGMSRIN